MDLTRDEVLERLCKIVSKVFIANASGPADCFCKSSVFKPYGKVDLNNYHFDDSYLDFIEEAVDEAISKYKEVK